MRRREFIGGLGGLAAGPFSAHAQQRDRMKRIGVLMNTQSDDPEGQERFAAFLQGLQEAGWAVGRNVRVEARWAAANLDLLQQRLTELVALEPDVIFSSGGTATIALGRYARAIPNVFVQVTDPVGSGVVASLARPSGNATGFTQSEYGISAKWLELLKEIAPLLNRVAVLRDPTNPAAIGQLAAMQAVSPNFGIELSPMDVRDPEEIKSAVAEFARGSHRGLVVVTGAAGRQNRNLIIALAAHHKLPAVYTARYYVASGGLISYGPDTIDPFRRAASYVDRILKGEKPADLPVQASSKLELALNLKTAKALGIGLSPTLLARADEVIE